MVKDISYNLVDNPLAEKYKGCVPPMCTNKDLPPEDFEVRKCVAEYKLIYINEKEYGFWSRVFNKEKKYKWLEAVSSRSKKGRELQLLLSKSQEHYAAFQRIINDMPEWVLVREVLKQYLIK